MFEISDIQKISKNRPIAGHWNRDFLNRHHLTGWMFSKTSNKDFQPTWKEQWTRNLLVKDELERLGRDIQRECLKVILLKGYSLMGDIYEDWGARFASDVDIFVNLTNLWRLTDILALHGFRKVSEEKWLGNRHKFLYRKMNQNLEVNIEVHTQLFWHTEGDWWTDTRLAPIEGFQMLSFEKQLLHLCGHLGFQHTFVKLFWLVDIFSFLKKYAEKIRWEMLWQESLNVGLFKSTGIALELCRQMGLELDFSTINRPKKYRVSLFLLKNWLKPWFLYDPQRRSLRYLAIKFLLKDSIYLNFSYGWAWLRHRLNSKS